QSKLLLDGPEFAPRLGPPLHHAAVLGPSRAELGLDRFETASSFFELAIVRDHCVMVRHRRIPLRRESRDVLAGGPCQVGETAPARESYNDKPRANQEGPFGPEERIEHGTPPPRHEGHPPGSGVDRTAHRRFSQPVPSWLRTREQPLPFITGPGQ